MNRAMLLRELLPDVDGVSPNCGHRLDPGQPRDPAGDAFVPFPVRRAGLWFVEQASSGATRFLSNQAGRVARARGWIACRPARTHGEMGSVQRHRRAR